MENHTPGEWLLETFGGCGDGDISVYAKTPINGNPRWVARVYGGGILAPGGRNPETLANARLIAAAPKLLAAAEALCAAIDAQYEADQESYFAGWPEKHALDEIIARARGDM